MSPIPEILKRTGDEPPRTSSTPVRELCRTAVDAILDKKAKDIVVMDMRGVSGIADMFVICTGESELQTKAVADAVVDSIRESHAERPWHKEGYDHRQWILLDYVDLVVHIFHPERREFYGLERLWGDAPIAEVDPTGTAADVELLQGDPS